jgi:hypothetical protein
MSSTYRHLLLDFFWQVTSGPACIQGVTEFVRQTYCYVINFLFLTTYSNGHQRKLKFPNFTGGKFKITISETDWLQVLHKTHLRLESKTVGNINDFSQLQCCIRCWTETRE